MLDNFKMEKSTASYDETCITRGIQSSQLGIEAERDGIPYLLIPFTGRLHASLASYEEAVSLFAS